MRGLARTKQNDRFVRALGIREVGERLGRFGKLGMFKIWIK